MHNQAVAPLSRALALCSGRSKTWRWPLGSPTPKGGPLVAPNCLGTSCLEDPLPVLEPSCLPSQPMVLGIETKGSSLLVTSSALPSGTSLAQTRLHPFCSPTASPASRGAAPAGSPGTGSRDPRSPSQGSQGHLQGHQQPDRQLHGLLLVCSILQIVPKH